MRRCRLSHGWHVIKLEETREVAPPQFDQVKQRVEQMVQGKKFKAYVDDLMKTAKVEKKLENVPAGGAAPAAAAACSCGFSSCWGREEIRV